MSIPNASPQPQQPAAPQYQQGAPNPYMQNTPQPPVATVPLDQPYYGCPFPEAFIRFWKKYATFKGRASRSEFWWFMLANVIIAFMLSAIANAVDQLSFLPALWALATFIPTLALATRRLHDTNKSGWWLFGYYALSTVIMITVFTTVITSIVSLLKYNRNCLVGSYGMYSANAFGTSNGITPESVSNCLASSGIMQSGIILAICLIIGLALSITYVVFMAMASKPEGARFDARTTQPQMPAPLYGAPSYAATAYGAPTYGNPAYAQPNNQAPVYTTPAAPTGPGAPGTPGAMNTTAYQQNPMAPTATQPADYPSPAYQVPPIPAMPPMPQPEPTYGQTTAQTATQSAQHPFDSGNAFNPTDAGQIPFDTAQQRPFGEESPAPQGDEPVAQQNDAHGSTTDAATGENAQ